MYFISELYLGNFPINTLPLFSNLILFSAENRCNVANHHGNNIKASTDATPAAKSL